MTWIELLAIAVALAMDAFAVAIVAGSTLDRVTGRHIFRLAFHFGLFQAIMPVFGWAGGLALQRHLGAIDHWVAFGLLSFVGGRMLVGALRADDEPSIKTDPTSGWTLVALSIATSIDALAVGMSLAIIGKDVVFPAIVIGIVAAAFTVAGMSLGRRVDTRWGKIVEVAGGLILIAIGVKVVIEHIG